MIVCSCKGVGSTQLEALLRSGCHTVEAIGRACGAGTDCGGCLAHLREQLEARSPAREGQSGVARTRLRLLEDANAA